MIKNHNLRRLICLLLLLSLCLGALGGCRKAPVPGPADTPDSPGEQGTQEERENQETLFDLYLDELFAKIATSDSITMNYMLADPSSYGLKQPAPTYGEVMTVDAIHKDREENLEIAARLGEFDYKDLRSDQQIIYDILTRSVELAMAMNEEDEYYYYTGYITPVNGLQVDLPILLAEFHFYTAKDIETYLRLLEDTQRLFDEIIGFERERSRRGFFLNEANVDKVVSHLESFLEDRENNLLILIFDDRIDNYEGLSDRQREQFKQKNRELVLGNVLPAYEALLDAMRELRGAGANQGGMADLPEGKRYAGLYLQYKTGSDRTPEQIDALLAERMDWSLTRIRDILSRYPDIAEEFFGDALNNIPYETPEIYLDMLEKAMRQDFPAIEPVQYVVNEVHEILQEFLSPAFYLTPALDDYANNVIYINPSSLTDNLSMFTTLAHEGYPGHMYQTVYYLQQSPHPIRSAMSHKGYVEGWATYVEMQSYAFSVLDDDRAGLMRYSNFFDLLIYARIDLGVNALGWELEHVAAFLGNMGIEGRDTIESIYNVVAGDPLLYLPYCLGYLEILSLLDKSVKALKDDFDLMEFHRFFLDFGPAPFPIIRDHMQDWIETQSTNALRPAA